jgi:hypothetical protein
MRWLVDVVGLVLSLVGIGLVLLFAFGALAYFGMLAVVAFRVVVGVPFRWVRRR